jgi:hypothetical protein
MKNDLTKRVLLAVAQCLPDDGPTHLTGCEVRRGWGGIVTVTLHATRPPLVDGPAIDREYRQAVSQALVSERHVVELIWEHAE